MAFTGWALILRDMEDTTATTVTTTGSRLRAGIVAVGAALGLSLAGLGVSAAQTEPTPTEPPADEAPAPDGARRHRGGPDHARGHGPAKGIGKGLGIHGEFVVKTADGSGYQTMATQSGEVTEVNATSLTVKSEDGFTRTYTVNDDTMVNAGNDGIADVEQGDQVHVMSVVQDGKAQALHVRDATKVKAHRDKWMPRRQAPPAESGSGGTSS